MIKRTGWKNSSIVSTGGSPMYHILIHVALADGHLVDLGALQRGLEVIDRWRVVKHQRARLVGGPRAGAIDSEGRHFEEFGFVLIWAVIYGV
jgi:hypothetical protein